MNRLSCLVAAVVASCLVLAARSERAEACSPPPPVWIAEAVGVPITGVPVQGVVPVFAETDPSAAHEIVVTVLDEEELPVAGSVELLPRRLIWRSEAPLMPEATYRLVVEIEGWGDEVSEVMFTTAAEGAPLPPAPELAAGWTLGEEERADQTLCCDTGDVGTCDFEEYAHCWAQAYEYRPRLSLTHDIDDDARRYVTFAVSAAGAEVAQRLDAPGSNSAAAVFAARQVSYCATVSATSLLDGAVTAAQTCANDAELVPAEPSGAQEPDPSMCEGPLVDGETGEEVSWPFGNGDGAGDGGDDEDDQVMGCAAGGGGSAALGLLAFVPLLLRRRRSRSCSRSR